MFIWLGVFGLGFCPRIFRHMTRASKKKLLTKASNTQHCKHVSLMLGDKIQMDAAYFSLSIYGPPDFLDWRFCRILESSTSSFPIRPPSPSPPAAMVAGAGWDGGLDPRSSSV